MEAVVSDILQQRKSEPGGLSKTASISFAAHVIALGALALVPGLMPKAVQPPRVVMSISLGGAPGPNNGGMQMMGGRNIQAAAPSEAPTIVRNPPPSVTPPKMALPDPKQKPRTPPKPAETSKDPKGTQRGKGFETQTGTARAETGAKGPGFGLSTGGGGGDGGVRLGVENFCCPEYIIDMRNRIINNWNQNQKTTGVVTMFFTIQRSGEITAVEVERSSGNPILDLASQRALMTTKMLAPLPAAFPERQLPVHLEFVYDR
jgi:TonB family protein